MDKLKRNLEDVSELGRRRIGTVEFPKYGLCPTTFFAFTLFFLALVRSGNNQISCFTAGKLSAEQALYITAFSSAIASCVHFSY